MNRTWTAAAACLAFTACASNPPSSPGATVAGPAQERAPAESAESAGDIEVAEIPTVPQVAYAPAEDKMVCSYEKKTGSNRATRICRKQSEIDKEATAAKRTFEDLHRSQREYQQ